MSKISVLMNCFNGAQFINEAIDSVYAQTYLDWEIVFVDNCSTDESQVIASTYDSNLKVYRTNENVNLGLARNFGISKCSGEYILFLDVDDIWLPNAIEILLALITSGDYALAYGGHLNINSDNVNIGRMLPKKKKGFIFGNLLKQFDIPIVGSIISSQHLLESGLSFDGNVHASEEYCLFMQLATRYQFISVDEPITQYRIHDNALSNKTISRRAIERRYTLDKIRRENPQVIIRYQKEFKEAYARAAYYDAQYFMHIKDNKSATNALNKYKYHSFMYFILYILTKKFSGVWYRLQTLKYGRTLKDAD